jgi:hypothetical protein
MRRRWRLPVQHCRNGLRAVGTFLEKRRPPEEFRSKLDYQVRIDGSTVQLIEVRPHWKGQLDFSKAPFAQARWIASRQVWRLYWMRSDLRWHSYPELPETKTLEEALAEVDRDPCGCFFG